MVVERFLALLAALEKHQVDYILVGGVAVNVHGIVRATEDVDLLVRPEPENVERLRRALRSVWDDPSIDEIRVEDLAGDYPTIRYGPPEGDIFVDVLGRLGEAVRYDDLEHEVQEIQGIAVRVATPRSLFLMKREMVRPVDRGDAASLRERFGLED